MYSWTQRHIPVSWKILRRLLLPTFPSQHLTAPSSDFRGPSPGHSHDWARQWPSPHLPTPQPWSSAQAKERTQDPIQVHKSSSGRSEKPELEERSPVSYSTPFLLWLWGCKQANCMRAVESGDRCGEWRQMGSVDTAPDSGCSALLQFPSIHSVCLSRFCFTSSRWVLRKSQHYVGKSGKTRNSSNKRMSNYRNSLIQNWSHSGPDRNFSQILGMAAGIHLPNRLHWSCRSYSWDWMVETAWTS